ncbi:hypothetical protein ATCC27039_08690 [Actinomyces naeslundii]|nr:hypothetical protein ATCC27039_08690 [Actinomyces naeslundii]
MTRPTGPSGPTIAGELEESADSTVSTLTADWAETGSVELSNRPEAEGSRGVDDTGETGETGEAWESEGSPPLTGERGESDCGWLMGLGWHGEHHRDQPCDEPNTSDLLGSGSRSASPHRRPLHGISRVLCVAGG